MNHLPFKCDVDVLEYGMLLFACREWTYVELMTYMESVKNHTLAACQRKAFLAYQKCREFPESQAPSRETSILRTNPTSKVLSVKDIKITIDGNQYEEGQEYPTPELGTPESDHDDVCNDNDVYQ